MDSSTLLALLGVMATLSGVAVTISLFIISNIKSDMKTAHESFSQSNKNLWESLNKISSELAAFKEHVALSHPREERVNEKLEFHKTHTDQVLSGINHRLQRIESESKEVMQAVAGLSSRQEEGMETLTSLLTKLLEEKKSNG